MSDRKDPPHIGYIVSSYKFCQHASYESANNERKRLAEKCPQKTFRIMKVLNCKGPVTDEALKEADPRP